MTLSAEQPAILAVQLVGGPQWIPGDQIRRVCGPVACLGLLGTRWRCDMIVIGVAVRDVPSRAVLVELVDTLRHHPESRTTPVVALLDEWHRELIVSLRKAGLERIGVQAYGKAMDSMEVFRMASRCPARFDIRQILSRLCPFLRYPVFDGGRELTACGACRNRMVLGGDRLKFVCQTTDHRFCDFFRNGESTP